MSADFVVPQEHVVYMNCLNDMRRFETAYTGLRFFDLKRWGIEYNHVYGFNNDTGEFLEDIHLAWDDPRRAIEVPQEVLSAGMASSQTPVTGNNNGGSYLRFDDFRNVHNK
jgi:hypothetical protein